MMMTMNVINVVIICVGRRYMWSDCTGRARPQSL